MNKFLKNMTFKFGGLFAVLSMVVTASIANSTCAWFTYQDEMPREAMKLRRF